VTIEVLNRSRLQRWFFGLAGALIAMYLATGVGWAHAFLDSATPAEGSSVEEAPGELRLSFTEPIEVAFSSVTVTGPNGQNVAQAIPQSGITDSITVPLGAMGPGEYTVEWRVLSIDTHTTDGKYTFTVLGDSGASPGTPPAGSADGAETETPVAETDDGGGFGWGWPVAAVVVLGLVLVLMRGRR